MTMRLTPSLSDRNDGGRLGGAPPSAIESHPLMETHRYLLTLPADIAPWTGGRELSVLLRAGFGITDEDIVYPNMAMRALLHEPSIRGSHPELCWPGLKPAALIECPDDIDPLVRVVNEPVLIQGDPSYADAVLADGHEFLFQIDEAGWPDDGALAELIDDYLWGFGSVYFYGTPAADGIVHDLVAGFIDF